MPVLLFALIAGAAWIGVVAVALAMCKATSRADAAGEYVPAGSRIRTSDRVRRALLS